MPLVYDHLEKFVAFSHSEWTGLPQGDTWFGRGFGESNPDYISRYIMPENAQLKRLVFYFDRELTQNWPAGGTISFQIFKEAPAYGIDPPTNPPCAADPPPPAGTGTQIFPTTAGDYYDITDSNAICFNHGRDPRNNTTGTLSDSSYYILSDVGVVLESGSALSFVAKASWNMSDAPAEVSVEIYYGQV